MVVFAQKSGNAYKIETLPQAEKCQKTPKTVQCA